MPLPDVITTTNKGLQTLYYAILKSQQEMDDKLAAVETERDMLKSKVAGMERIESKKMDMVSLERSRV